MAMDPQLSFSAIASQLSAMQPTTAVHPINTIFGSAAWRTQAIESLVPEVVRWASSRPDVALFGRRAWNAHLRHRSTRIPTSDVDLIFVRPFGPEFWHAGIALASTLIPLVARFGPVNCFAHTHHDGGGVTITVQTCGITLADLSARCQPVIALRTVRCAVAEMEMNVLARETMFSLLDLEARDLTNYRREHAANMIDYYRMCERQGYFDSDDERHAKRAKRKLVAKAIVRSSRTAPSSPSVDHNPPAEKRDASTQTDPVVADMVAACMSQLRTVLHNMRGKKAVVPDEVLRRLWVPDACDVFESV